MSGRLSSKVDFYKNSYPFACKVSNERSGNAGFAALIIGFLLWLICVPLHAQSASVSGRVTDPTGAVVPNARVVVTREDTETARQSPSNGEGLYIVPFVQPGAYRLEVRADGFKRFEQLGITIETAQNATIDDQLQIGDVAETVMVEITTPLVNESDASVGSVVDREFVEKLPLNGSSFQQLIAINPGVVQAQASSQSPGQFSVNGQRTNANYFTVDGVSANFSASVAQSVGSRGQAYSGSLPTFSAQGGTNTLVSVDAMQEFKVQTSSYAPEFGRTPGGQIAITSRSGTNEFHGTLFNYFRNDALDANDWFANRDGLERPALRQNDFGGVLGGPIIKNRTFFFVSHESLRLRQPRFATEVYPSLAAREMAAEGIRPLVNAFPVPNREPVDEFSGRFAATFTNPSSLDATSVRIDHQLNDRATLFGRYNYADSEVSERGGFFSSLSVITRSKNPIHTLTLGSTQVFTPTITNEFRFNYSSHKSVRIQEGDDFGGAVPPPESLVRPSFADPENFSFGTGTFSGMAWNVGQSEQRQGQFNIVNNLAISRGSHQFKFGLDFTHERRTQDCAGSLVARPLRPGLPLGGAPFQGSGKSGPVKIFVPVVISRRDTLKR